MTDATAERDVKLSDSSMDDALGFDAQLEHLQARSQHLKLELRRALSLERLTERLHHERLAARSRLGLQLIRTGEARELESRLQVLRSQVIPEVEQRELQNELLFARQFLERLKQETKKVVEQDEPCMWTEASQAESCLELCTTSQSESPLALALAKEKQALQERLQTLLAGRNEIVTSPVPAVGPSTSTPPVLRQRRRLQQLEAIASGLHAELRRRGTGVTTPLTHTPVSTQFQSPAIPGTGSQAAWSLTTSRRQLRTEQLEQKIKALSQRFLLLRDVR